MSIGLLVSAASYLLIGPIPLLQPLLGPQMYWLVWVALGGVGIGAGMTFVPSLPALLHASRTLVRAATLQRLCIAGASCLFHLPHCIMILTGYTASHPCEASASGSRKQGLMLCAPWSEALHRTHLSSMHAP